MNSGRRRDKNRADVLGTHVHDHRGRPVRPGFIGRAEVFEEMRSILAGLFDGRGHVISLIGAEGIGKSRLAAELRASAEPSESGPIWLEGRCYEQAAAAAYQPLHDILHAYLGWTPAQPLDEMRERLADRLDRLVTAGTLDRDDRDEAELLLSRVLAVSVEDTPVTPALASPEQAKYRTFEAIRNVVLGIATQRPLVLVFDDLHFADRLSFELVVHLMDAVNEAPILMLCLYQPTEADHPVANLGKLTSLKCRGRYTPFQLRELEPEQAWDLAQAILRDTPMPSALVHAVLAKTGGNPLFIEQFLRGLMDTYHDKTRGDASVGDVAIEIPETVQEVILTRVNRLRPDARNVLDRLAVIGAWCGMELLESVTPPSINLDVALGELVHRGFLVEETAFPEAEFSFCHAIVRDTIYETLSPEERSRFHRAIAEAIETVYPHRIDEFCGDLASRYSLCGDRVKALDYLLKAGRQARGHHANETAAEHFRRALQFIRERPPTDESRALEAKVREERGDALLALGKHTDAEHEYAHALELAEQDENEGEWHLPALIAKLAEAIYWQRAFDRALEAVDMGLVRLGVRGGFRERVALLEVGCRTAWAKNDWATARHYADELASILERTPYFDQIHKAYYSVAYTEMHNGSVAAAIGWLLKQKKVCEEHGNEEGVAWALHGLGDLYRSKLNNFAQARQQLDASLLHARRTGNAHLLFEGHLEVAQALIALNGDPQRIREHVDKGIEIAQTMAVLSGGVAEAPEICEMVSDEFRNGSDLESALWLLREAIDLGPSDLTLYRLLRKMEEYLIQLGRRDEYADFCRSALPGIAARTGTGFRHWFLEPAEPATTLSRPMNCAPLGGQGWEWIDPHADSRFSVDPSKGTVAIHVARGRSVGVMHLTAPRLLRVVEGDFAAQVRLVGIEPDARQSGGLIVWESDGTYACFGKRSSLESEMRFDVSRAGSHEIIGRGWICGSEVHVRLERQGDALRALCSADGRTWYCCGETFFSKCSPVYVGVYAACSWNMASSTLLFRAFELFQSEEKG